MSCTYKRILNELSKINIEKDITYQLVTIESSNILFRCDINLKYKNIIYNIKIYYDRYYPFHCPTKLEIQYQNIFDIYQRIINLNSNIFNKHECLCCKSLLCYKNWNISKNINDILKEIKLVIDYKQIYIKRLLLKKIINIYTNENMDYLERYLL